MTQQPDLFGGRRPQQRWSAAGGRRVAAKTRFEALPADERAAIWARIDRLLFVEASWIRAKTMPENPHSYTKRRTWKDDADFVWLVTMIREGGVADREKYDGRWYDVLNRVHDDVTFKIWPMGWPVNHSDGRPWTILLNRKPCLPTDR